MAALNSLGKSNILERISAIGHFFVERVRRSEDNAEAVTTTPIAKELAAENPDSTTINILGQINYCKREMLNE